MKDKLPIGGTSDALLAEFVDDEDLWDHLFNKQQKYNSDPLKGAYSTALKVVGMTILGNLAAKHQNKLIEAIGGLGGGGGGGETTAGAKGEPVNMRQRREGTILADDDDDDNLMDSDDGTETPELPEEFAHIVPQGDTVSMSVEDQRAVEALSRQPKSKPKPVAKS